MLALSASSQQAERQEMSLTELDTYAADGFVEDSLEEAPAVHGLEAISFSEGISIRLTQLRALAYKEFCFSIKREWLRSLIRLLLPTAILLGMFVVVLLHPTLSSDLHPSAQLVGDIPKCTTGHSNGKCVSLLYNINGALEVDGWAYSFYHEQKAPASERRPATTAAVVSDNRNVVLDTMRRFYNQTNLASTWYGDIFDDVDVEVEEPVRNVHQVVKEGDTVTPPTREFADAVMQILCETNPETEIKLGQDVMFTELADDDLRSYLSEAKHANTTLGVVEFLPTITTETGGTVLNYRVMYNVTTLTNWKFDGSHSYYYPNNIRFEIEAAVERSLLAYLAREGEAGSLNDVSFSSSYKPLPSTNAAETATTLWTLAVPVLLVAVGAHYLYVQVTMSADKETGRRGQMKLAGMRDSSYWVASVTRQVTFAVVSLGLMVVVGWLLPPFVLFHKASLLPLIAIFVSFAAFFAAIANLTSVLVASRKVAIILASLHFGFFLVLVFLLSLLDGSILSVFTHNGWLNSGVFLATIFPPFSFTAILVEVMINTVPGSAKSSCWGSAYPAKGYHWKQFLWDPVSHSHTSSSSYCHYVYPAPAVLLLAILLLQAAIIFLLALWLDKVRSDKHKAAIACCFCCAPSYWRRGKARDDGYQQAALVIEHLTKTYKTGLFKTNGVDAIRPFQMEGRGDSVLCLLGPNGAGKTTIIGCLTGLVQPTEGDAFIYGYSIRESMDAIRSMMGVCPQFDMLFEDLSAWEHMRIVNWMKRPCDRMTDDELKERLAAVKLTSVEQQAVKTYSGGMKRRLSFALSTVGNPRILFLDEPTTGMDPSNRRYVWDLVRSIKKGRLVILTTHSMEEADMLGDQIAIVASGKLRCEGTAMELKNRFGLGYRLTISCDPNNVDEVKNLAHRYLPVAQLRGDNAGALVYSLPEVDKSSSEFFQLLLSSTTADGSPLIDDWGCQNTTMEDVFLTVSRKIMGQDITFDASNKRSRLDRDEREIFQQSTRRLDRRIRYFKDEVQELRERLAAHGIDADDILGAADRAEQIDVRAE